MRVDQSGHQGVPFEIDSLGGGAADRPVRDLADQPALDEHVMLLTQLLGGAVKNRAVGENDGRHRQTSSRCPRELRLDTRYAEAGSLPNRRAATNVAAGTPWEKSDVDTDHRRYR